jgi:NDP-sugar pyrophosphorylase family protein
MNVIITLAGHSRRFKEAGYSLPKYLIPIDGVPMISHVVNMFDPTDHFYFVINTQQVDEYPQTIPLLKSLAKKVDVTVIEPHELGPTYSALQVASIPDDSKVIISYCDFIVRWNYQQFLRVVHDYAGAVPAFRGFHPASFGKTHYAYMRVNAGNEMDELREKSSFTAERHNEFASAGIYYFREMSLFRCYAEKLLKTGFGNLSEAYVSLLFNKLVEDGFKIKVTEVDNFICWGTPEDLAQYYFWSHYFNTSQLKGEIKAKQKQINLIPMGGKGNRFRTYGYRVSKPLIQVREKPMIVAACESFPSADTWIFLPRSEDSEKHPIEKALKKFSKDAIVIPVHHDTSGQAATCLLAKDYLDKGASLFIASCDYETRFSSTAWRAIIEDEKIDGAIWTCRIGNNLTKDPKAFAYCVTDDGMTIRKIVEKDTISITPEKDPLVVGSFWFRTAEDFIFAAETAIKTNLHVNGEHYVANSINLLIQKGKRFVIFDVDQWISYGDPFELQVYQYWEDFFIHYNHSSILSQGATV